MPGHTSSWLSGAKVHSICGYHDDPACLKPHGLYIGKSSFIITPVSDREGPETPTNMHIHKITDTTYHYYSL